MIKNIPLIIILIIAAAGCRDNFVFTEPDENGSESDVKAEDVYFIHPVEGDTFYPGNEIKLEFKFYSTAKTIDISVIKKNVERYKIAENIENTGSFAWQTTSDIKPSVQYQFRIVNSDKPNMTLTSDIFRLLNLQR